jgi:hypothetical protein
MLIVWIFIEDAIVTDGSGFRIIWWKKSQVKPEILLGGLHLSERRTK